MSPHGDAVVAVRDKFSSPSDNAACTFAREIENPILGSAEQLLTWTEVITGCHLTDKGVVETLGPDAWSERKESSWRDFLPPPAGVLLRNH